MINLLVFTRINIFYKTIFLGDSMESIEFKHLRPLEQEICRLAIKYQMDIGKMSFVELDKLLSDEDKRSLKHIVKYGRRIN
tara:strand:- start:288 stop:530 length:243 start_codon:yes stop_codon:yes gene_type:complete